MEVLLVSILVEYRTSQEMSVLREVKQEVKQEVKHEVNKSRAYTYYPIGPIIGKRRE